MKVNSIKLLATGIVAMLVFSSCNNNNTELKKTSGPKEYSSQSELEANFLPLNEYPKLRSLSTNQDSIKQSSFTIVRFEKFGWWSDDDNDCHYYFGLCRAVWFPDFRDPSPEDLDKKVDDAIHNSTRSLDTNSEGRNVKLGSRIYRDEKTGEQFILVLLSKNAKEYPVFHVAKDIELPSNGHDSLGVTKFIKSGEYKYNPRLGSFGGYKILVIDAQ